MGYATFPFVLFEFEASLKLYLRFFMCLHLVALATIFILPKFISGERGRNTTSQPNHSSNGTLKTNKDLSSNGNLNDNNNCVNKDLIDNRDARKLVAVDANVERDDEERDDGKFCRNNCSNRFNNSCDEHDVEQTNQKSLNDTNYLLKDLIHNKIKDGDNLSNLIKEKIDICNIEGLIDLKNKTVNEIVELKDHLMRIEDYAKTTTQSGDLRKRLNANGENDGLNGEPTNGGVDAFLKKEIDAINAAVQEAKMLPAVLTNGHGK
jgi:lysophospholipid acyltransferase 1/2